MQKKDNMKSYRSIYSVVDHIREKGLVFYGAGATGKVAFRIFSLFQVRPTYVCDDNLKKQGTVFECDGFSAPILSLEEAATRLPNAVYIIASHSHNQNGPWEKMKARLVNLNVFSEDSQLYPLRYAFLLEGGFEGLQHAESPGNSSFTPERIDNIVIFSSAGRSGNIFFDTLMDGHPNILNIGMFGVAALEKHYKEQLHNLEGNELVVEMGRHMQLYFSSSLYPRCLLSYLNADGEVEEKTLISPQRFIASLKGILAGRGRVSFAVLCKAVFAAYGNVIGKQYVPGQEYWIFFETHKSDCSTTELDGLITYENFRKIEHLVIVREPVQQWFSSIQQCYRLVILEQKLIPWWITQCNNFFGSLGTGLEQDLIAPNKRIKVIRFEDAKKKTRATMQAVCNWIEIEFDECLLQTTINGIEVYFPGAVTDQKKTISGQDTTAVDRHDFSKFFSSYDIFRLNLLFQNVQKAYGYPCDVPDYHSFSKEFLQELYRAPFRCESWLDHQYAEAQKNGYAKQGDQPFSDFIREIIQDYLEKDQHNLITDVICPSEEETL